MIFKLRKNFYDYSNDYPIKNVLGETVCKIAVLDKGYYIYNKIGAQLGQVVFENGGATISIVKAKASFPGAIKIFMVNKDRVEFITNEIEKGDERFASNVKGEKPLSFSVWGKPLEYGYDIYEGNTLLSNIVPSATNGVEYNIRTNNDTNLLYVLLFSIAIERLLFDPSYAAKK